MNILSTENVDWETANWYNHLVHYLVGFGIFINALATNQGRATALFYFALSTSLVIINGLNCAFIRGRLRQMTGTAVILVNIFIIPFSIHAYGQSVGISSLAGISYVVATIAICPLEIGVVALVAGVIFSYFQKKYFIQSYTITTAEELPFLGLAYAGLAILAFCWRILIKKMYDLFKSGEQTQCGDSENSKAVMGKYDELANEHRLLKEEIALHIMEINHITEGKDGTIGSGAF